jgi:hypothetical protein
MNHLAHTKDHEAHEGYLGGDGAPCLYYTLRLLRSLRLRSGHAFAAISSYFVLFVPFVVRMTVILLCELAEHRPAWRAIGTREFHRRAE